MSNQRVRQCCTYVAVAGASIGLLAGLNTSPVFAKPKDDKPAASAGSIKRVMPIAEGRYRISTPFGVAGPLWSSGHHTGLDFGASPGTPILAAAAGVVTFVGNGGAYGNLTRIDHGGGLETWYAHQSAFIANVGTQVRPGQPIGAVGSTGNSTGPHLHFEVRINDAHSDPLAWLAGAKAVPATGVAGGTLNAAAAEGVRADIVQAEMGLQLAQAESIKASAEEAKVRKKLKKARIAADKAKAVLADYAREVYKSGADPQFLLQADALSSGDLTQFTDREVLLTYANNSQNRMVTDAIAAIKRASVLHDKAEAIKVAADTKLTAATKRAEEVLGSADSEGAPISLGSTWDGEIPSGGSAKAMKAVKFAVSQVGQPYTRAGGTGPSYGCNGFAWRSLKEGGFKWPLMQANAQATNRSYVVPVTAGQEKAGDLVFWRMNNGTAPAGQIDHVGVVVNPNTGTFVHASSPRTGVEINNYKTTDFYKNVAQFGRAR